MFDEQEIYGIIEANIGALVDITIAVKIFGLNLLNNNANTDTCKNDITEIKKSL